MKIGTIVQAKYFNGVVPTDEAKRYQALLANNFSQAGMFAFGQMPFVAGKGPDPEKDYDWRNVDALVDFGKKNTVEILYNTVINSHANSFPEWYKALQPDQKVAAIKRHVKAVIGRYKGKIKIFKLVNEAVHDVEDDYLGTGQKRDVLIAKIFVWAKEEYPEGVFMINDHFPFIKDDEIRPKFIDLVKRVLVAGGPIDVVGIEGHLGYRPLQQQLPPDGDIHTTLDDVRQQTNLPIHITEFDLSYDNNPQNPYPGSKIAPSLPFSAGGLSYNNWFEYQAFAYQHFYEICKEKGYIESLVFWGLRDDSKITWERPGTGFFNEDFTPKPVYEGMKDIFLGALNI